MLLPANSRHGCWPTGESFLREEGACIQSGAFRRLMYCLQINFHIPQYSCAHVLNNLKMESFWQSCDADLAVWVQCLLVFGHGLNVRAVCQPGFSVLEISTVHCLSGLMWQSSEACRRSVCLCYSPSMISCAPPSIPSPVFSSFDSPHTRCCEMVSVEPA